jgi:adenylosuccinate lyase
LKVSDDFLRSLGLVREQFTTQISQYDNLGALCDNTKRINTIMLDLCADTWTYISYDYFKQSIIENEVGSSAMPHKGNLFSKHDPQLIYPCTYYSKPN